MLNVNASVKTIVVLLLMTIWGLSAYGLQYKMGLHGDVSYLIYAANLILAGKQYGLDFFETNPPMILYLYFPVLFLAKLTHLSIASCLQLYVFSLAFNSVLFSWWMLKKIISDKILLSFFINVILFVLLILPSNQFGQREHLFVILILPYLFSSTLNLNQQNLPSAFKFVIGLMAGLGFCIKPYFIFPLIFIELYFIVKKRSIFGWVRIESITILAIMVIYLVTTILFFSTYFTILLNLINHFYFIGIKEYWSHILLKDLILFSVVTFAIYFFANRNQRYHTLKTILMLCLGGSILALFITRTSWFYHAIPSLSMACLMLALYFGEFIAEWFVPPLKFNSYQLPIIIMIGMMLFYVPLMSTYITVTYYIQDKNHGDGIKLTHYLSAQPGEHSIACFSANTTGDCFPLITDTKSNYGSRYPFFWWMRGVVFLSHVNGMPKNRLEQYQNYFIESIAHDLKQFQARWVVINKEDAAIIFGRHFNFITFFSENLLFRHAWSAYHYKTTIGHYELYERQRSLTF